MILNEGDKDDKYIEEKLKTDEEIGEIYNGYKIIGISRIDKYDRKFYLIECEKCHQQKILRLPVLLRGNKSCRNCYLQSFIGKKFGRLTVISYNEERSNRSKDKRASKAYFDCQCSCENKTIKTIRIDHLLDGSTQSCGCISYDKYSAKGHWGERLYWIHHGMKQRCYNPHDKKYPIYGGKGITVCDEWIPFIGFYNWAMNNGYNDTLTIDRMDSRKNYCPENCRWVSTKIQNFNTSQNRPTKLINIINGMALYFAAFTEAVEYIGSNPESARYYADKNGYCDIGNYRVEYYNDGIYNLIGGIPKLLTNPAIFHNQNTLANPAIFHTKKGLISPAKFFK